jgi:hypothetical protein
MPGKGEPKESQSQPKRDKSQDPGELQKQPDDPQKPEKKDPNGGKCAGDPNSKDGDPKSGKADKHRPEQKDAERPPPNGPTGEFQRADVSGRWGVLPAKEAEDLQRRDAEEFPERYRRWMELYFNRVNRLQARDR